MNLMLAMLTVRAKLTDDLRRPCWRGRANRFAGHCYVAAEALYHLAAKREGYKPATLRHECAVHWYLVSADGAVLDPTVEQFETVPDYLCGRRRGFLTLEPSRRARTLMKRCGVEVEELDCTLCGACCVADYDCESYVNVNVDDFARLTERERRLLVREDGLTYAGDVVLRSLSTKYDRRGNCRCKALRGTVGRRVSCSIYDRRPRVCSRFKPGSKACLVAREESGIISV